jgi:AAA+ superfamily predicted ATPase
MDLLGHISTIIDIASEEKGLTEKFHAKAKESIAFVSSVLKITPIQGILFAHFLNAAETRAFPLHRVSKALRCNNVQFLRYIKEIDELEKKRLVKKTGRTGFDEADSGELYFITRDVIEALKQGCAYEPKHYKNISLKKLFEVLETLFNKRKEDEIDYDELISELETLLKDNPQSDFVKTLKSYRLNTDSKVLLLYFCHRFANDGEEKINPNELSDLYQNRFISRRITRNLNEGEHQLFKKELLEHSYRENFRDRQFVSLGAKAKKYLLKETEVPDSRGQKRKNYIRYEDITPKELFYNNNEKTQIEELAGLLENKNYRKVQARLLKNGMRRGFACLFSGSPGTGKTETVYQLALKTKRGIMKVDIAQTKSMWFGESQKKIKELFDKYRSLVSEAEQNGENTPILLFNEADGVFCKRKDVSASAVAQTENSMQNIILEEIENLEGILIATTNLKENIDKAFDRRFLYKIEFEKPGGETRKMIWKSIIPRLRAGEAEELSQKYQFSGGQIENIARKHLVNLVLSGRRAGSEKIAMMCESENTEKPKGKIGF